MMEKSQLSECCWPEFTVALTVGSVNAEVQQKFQRGF